MALPLSRRLKRTGDGCTGTGRNMENGELSEAFADEWSPAVADAALRDDEDESVIAEKWEAIVSLGLANSRIKDLHDLRSFSREFSFDSGLRCSVADFPLS